MKSKFFIVLLSCLCMSFSFAQEDDEIWQKLLKVDWEYKYSEEFEMDIPFPLFTNEVKALDNSEIVIKGFVLPVETEDNSIMLSVYPFSSCFFCGGAGPESVVAIFLKNHREIKEEEVTFKGTLHLNDEETGLIYELKDAVEFNSNY
ncbi:DUF3299 domain-containing protein [Flammeovirga yaeyamensis]|uniref:DUF3299 domain-containing protein n=2 Tax=Flammeovirga yaeyamensis TaxID=367791 RepID=A0AAX1MXY8_9BACT|nr:DUF3299 domain-containing protein [Flammeovirga yaeyamensis]MBB3696299.1 hypothetical protein [Flammeovirga yaeyamensis]QWG00195.1 DUF3299 domain-containing protein [Flammeovirga yaeyamensis]